MKIKTFYSTDVSWMDKDVNDFISGAKTGKPLQLKDIKVTAVVQPAGGFADQRGYATETMFIYTVMYEEEG